MSHVAPVNPDPMIFDHGVHVVTLRVQIKALLFFTLAELKCFWLKIHIISSAAQCAQGFLVGTCITSTSFIIWQ